MNTGTEKVTYKGEEYTCYWQTTPLSFDCTIYLYGDNVTEDISQYAYNYITTIVWNEITGVESDECTADFDDN
jgi:hypothetical protein